MLPQDPVMLLSFVNMKLRDMYTSFDAMVDDLGISSEESKAIVDKLNQIGYTYDKEKNKFI